VSPRVVLMQGLPASGKTTAARKLIADAARPLRYVGLDALRWMLAAEPRQAWWAPGAEAVTAAAQAGLVRALVDAGSDVLVDGTHLTPDQVDPLRAALAGVDVAWRVHAVVTPLDVCLARDAGRDQPVGQHCIRRLAADHQAATAAGWRLTPAWLAGAVDLEEVAA